MAEEEEPVGAQPNFNFVHLGKFLSTWICFAKDEYASIGAYAPYVHSIVNEASPGGSGCPVMGGGWCRPKPKLTQHAMLDTKTQEFPTTESQLPVMLLGRKEHEYEASVTNTLRWRWC